MIPYYKIVKDYLYTYTDGSTILISGDKRYVISISNENTYCLTIYTEEKFHFPVFTQDVIDANPNTFKPFIITSFTGFDLFLDDICYTINKTLDDYETVEHIVTLDSNFDKKDVFPLLEYAEKYIKIIKFSSKVNTHSILINTNLNTSHTVKAINNNEITLDNGLNLNFKYILTHKDNVTEDSINLYRLATMPEKAIFYLSKGYVKDAKVANTGITGIIDRIEITPNKTSLYFKDNNIEFDINNFKVI